MPCGGHSGQQPYACRGGPLDPAKKLGLSIGIAIFNADHPESAQEFMSRADDATYAAKNNNKKNIAIARQKCGSRQESKKF